MDVGAADRIIWALGGAAIHSRAFEERMWAFEFPEELQVRYGLPPLTEEAKRAILGENAARILGLDIAASVATRTATSSRSRASSRPHGRVSAETRQRSRAR
jgi:uncharacterized protein